ncbi:uncharacterized protein LOC133299401 [Gastrolobium bilobum]|uniref:uncharacterized protein LOC133299401 n=1 Tax=Gastrolobium bilobum TaxID=150636 RepID=UPI002AB1D3D7|nr:uncharacterized protein LOC133299401 [Gastrolobium bilobum]
MAGVRASNEEPIQSEISISAQRILALKNLHSPIVQPEIAAGNFELKPVMFDLLETIGLFNGMPSEDPLLHFKNFMEVADSFKIQGVTSNTLKMNLFPFSLTNGAKAWSNTLQPNSIRRWEDMAEKFLMKFFPHTKAILLRNDIATFQQYDGETPYKAWDRFKELLWKCPNHGIPEWVQMETFYNGFNDQTRGVVDASAGGALLARTFTEAYEILERMTLSNYQWPTERMNTPKKAVGMLKHNDVSVLAEHISSLNDTIKSFNLSADVRAHQVHAITNAISCVFCNVPHVYDNCTKNPRSVCFVGSYNMNNPYLNTYNQGWRSNSILLYSQGQQQEFSATTTHSNRISYPSEFMQQQHQSKQQVDTSNTLESMLKNFMAKSDALIQNQTASIKNLETRMGQLAEAINVRQYDTLPSSTEYPRRNEEEHIKAIEIKNGEEHVNAIAILGGEAKVLNQNEGDKAAKEVEIYYQPEKPQIAGTESTATTKLQQGQTVSKTIIPPSPLPQRLQKQQDAMQKEQTLSDLEAKVKLRPMTLLEKMGIRNIRSAKMTLHLPNRSIKASIGIVENMNVKIGKFAHQVDFVMLDIKEDPTISQFLEESFFDTQKVMVDMWKSDLILKMDGDQVHTIEYTEDGITNLDVPQSLRVGSKPKGEKGTDDQKRRTQATAKA